MWLQHCNAKVQVFQTFVGPHLQFDAQFFQLLAENLSMGALLPHCQDLSSLKWLKIALSVNHKTYKNSLDEKLENICSMAKAMSVFSKWSVLTPEDGIELSTTVTSQPL